MSEIQPNPSYSRPIRKRATSTRLASSSVSKQEHLKKHFTQHPERLVGTLVRYTPRAKGSRREEEVLGYVVGVRLEQNIHGEFVAYQKLYVVDVNRPDDPASSTRVISLLHDTKSWIPVPLTQWNGRRGMVGRRIVCHWKAEYATPGNKALQEKMRADKIPYEAFVVRVIGNGRYKILYTAEDSYYEADLIGNGEWAFVDDTQAHYNELPIVSWSMAGMEMGENVEEESEE